MAGHLIEQLEWNDELRLWQGYFTFPSGRVIDISVNPSEEMSYDFTETIHAVQASSSSFLSWFQTNEKVLCHAVAVYMLPLYNATWRKEAPITEEEFANRIELLGASFQPDNKNCHLSFSDGEMEMFGGHSIQAWFDEDHRIERCALWA